MDAVELLIQQHRLLEENMERLEKAGSDAERERLLAEVGDHLTVHITSEEKVFYPAVNAARTEDVLLESLEEHLSLKRLLADLLELSPGEQTFEPKFKVLKEQTEHHHKEEEEHLFPKVRTLLDAKARVALGQEMLALQQQLKREGAPREAVAEQTGQAAPLE